MKIVIAKNGKKRVKISKSDWKNIGKKAGWIKESQMLDFIDEDSKSSPLIPDDGYADGGSAYTNEEMDLIKIEEIKNNNNRPEKIKQMMDLYVDMHPTASGYELNTLWDDIGQMSTEDINRYIDQYASIWTRERQIN